MKTLVLLLLGAIATQAEDRWPGVYMCRAYTGDDFTGYHHDFTEYVPYLSAFNFDNTIASVRVVGVWLFYDHPEYNTYTAGAVHYSWGLDYYDSFHDAIHKKASSLRYAGNQERMNEDGYNLYHGKVFTGKDYYSSSDNPDLTAYMNEVASIIVIGHSSWLFCEGIYYSGRCECLSALWSDQDSYDRLDVGFYESISSSQVGLHTVRSVHHGCFL